MATDASSGGANAGSALSVKYQDTINKADIIEKSAKNIEILLDHVRQSMKQVNTEEVWESDAAAETYAKFEQLAKSFPGAFNAMMAFTRHLRDVVSINQEVDRVLAQKADESLSVNV